MGQSDALQRATERLDAAADQLEVLLSGVFADAEGGGSIAELKDQVHFLSQERERLLADLDAERNRVRRLKAANEEVSGRLEAVMVTLNHYLVLSAILFAIGAAGVFVRRNLITILLSIEIMLNAVNLTFVAVGRYLGTVDGQIITFFVMTVAAAEAAVGLALVIALFRHRETLSPDAFTLLKW